MVRSWGEESNSRVRDEYGACKLGNVLIHIGAVWRRHNPPGYSRRARVAADVTGFGAGRADIARFNFIHRE